MKNKYGLPEDHLARIRERDRSCVYCNKPMFGTRSPGTTQRDWATIEHLNHLPPWDNPRTVAFCCGSCNSSRGAKPILEWFDSEYCRARDIGPETVAEPVREYIRNHEGYEDKPHGRLNDQDAT